MVAESAFPVVMFSRVTGAARDRKRYGCPVSRRDSGILSTVREDNTPIDATFNIAVPVWATAVALVIVLVLRPLEFQRRRPK
jgi:hypothetical protein